jgi:hypothetical protein
MQHSFRSLDCQMQKSEGADKDDAGTRQGSTGVELPVYHFSAIPRPTYSFPLKSLQLQVDVNAVSMEAIIYHLDRIMKYFCRRGKNGNHTDTSTELPKAEQFEDIHVMISIIGGYIAEVNRCSCKFGADDEGGCQKASLRLKTGWRSVAHIGTKYFYLQRRGLVERPSLSPC